MPARRARLGAVCGCGRLLCLSRDNRHAGAHSRVWQRDRAELAESLGSRRLIWALFGLAGILALLWPLYNSVYPIPDFPRNLWPYVVITWIVAGVLLPIVRPALVLADDGPIGLDQRHRNDGVHERQSQQAFFTRFHAFSRADAEPRCEISEAVISPPDPNHRNVMRSG